MSVTGLGRIATAEKMSVDQLKEALENKTLPAYIAYPLIDEKLNMQERMQANAAMRQAQQPQAPISQGIDQRLAMTQGVDTLPSNLPTRGMAGGGIVAFEGGGQATSEDKKLNMEKMRRQIYNMTPGIFGPLGPIIGNYAAKKLNLPERIESLMGYHDQPVDFEEINPKTKTPSKVPKFEDGGKVIHASNGLPQDMFVNPYLANYIRQMETGGLRDPDAAVSPKGARGIMQIMPATAMKPGFGVPTIFDLADTAGIKYEGKTEDEAKRLLANRDLNVAFGERYAGAMQKKFGDNPFLAAAAYNAGPGAVQRAGGVPNIPETQKYVAGISPERFAAASESVRGARREQMGLPPLPAKPAPAQPIPGAAAAIEQVGDITTRGAAEDRQRQFMDILAGRAPVPKRATPNDPTLTAEAAPPGMPAKPPTAPAPTPEAKPEEDSDIAALRRSIAARRGELGKQREQDKYMALLAAGLGMMGGTSRNALQNIGQGAMQGVAALQASRKEQREAEQDVLASELGLSRATLYEKMRLDQLKSNKEIAAEKAATNRLLADLKRQQGYRDAADMWLNSPNRTALEADLKQRYGKNWKQDGRADLALNMARTKFIEELLTGGGLFSSNVPQANALLAR